MEEVNIRTLLSSIKVVRNDIQFTHYQMSIALNKGKKGDWQRHKLRLDYLKRKLKGLMDRLTNKLKGTILTVTYQVATPVNTKTFEQTFTNLTQQEIVDIMQIRAIMEGVEINILEIKEIPTQIREITMVLCKSDIHYSP
jgi:hypothetical protein